VNTNLSNGQFEPFVSMFAPIGGKRETKEGGWKADGNEMETRAEIGNEMETRAEMEIGDGNEGDCFWPFFVSAVSLAYLRPLSCPRVERLGRNPNARDEAEGGKARRWEADTPPPPLSKESFQPMRPDVLIASVIPR